MLELFEPNAPWYHLIDTTRTRDGADAQQQVREMKLNWSAVFQPGLQIPDSWVDPSGLGPNVTAEVDTPPVTFSIQSSGLSDNGSRTIDTFLDQVVFGMPITGFDLWQKAQLHETSRRRNMECGLDVIVASATNRAPIGHGYAAQVRKQFTAYEAAQVLVDIAKEQFPYSSLAKHTDWDRTALHPCEGIVG